MTEKQIAGTVNWMDLTVDDANGVRDFYKAVAGWESSPISMGEYDDYCMMPPGQDSAVAGICHARGSNSGVPPQWLIYISVDDMSAALAACEAQGGKVVDGPRGVGSGEMAVIQDPAGAVCGLYKA